MALLPGADPMTIFKMKCGKGRSMMAFTGQAAI